MFHVSVKFKPGLTLSKEWTHFKAVCNIASKVAWIIKVTGVLVCYCPMCG